MGPNAIDLMIVGQVVVICTCTTAVGLSQLALLPIIQRDNSAGTVQYRGGEIFNLDFILLSNRPQLKFSKVM